MRTWLLALIAATSRTLRTQTFAANATWTAPFATTRLESAAGKGAAGTPASSATHYYHDKYAYNVYHHRDGSYTDTIDSMQFISRSEVASADTPLPPGEQSAHFETPDDPVSDYWYIQYVYFRAQSTSSTPASTGAATTGFSKTFPGGTGGAASTTTFPNVAVTPGNPYPIVVPSGGTLTISWYQ